MTVASIPTVGAFPVRLSLREAKVIEAARAGLNSDLANGKIFVGDAAGDAQPVTPSGDVTISNTGVTAIASGVIVNADVKSDAAIAFSKLAALPSAQMLVGSAGNVAAAVAMSGDVTIANTGATAIGAGKVLLAMLGAGVTPSHLVKFVRTNSTSATLTGVAVGDICINILPGAAGVPVVSIDLSVATDTLPVAPATTSYWTIVLRAAA